MTIDKDGGGTATTTTTPAAAAMITTMTMGDIWSGEGASTAFSEGTLRSSRSAGGGGAAKLAVVFRNETRAPLLLCWVSDSGRPFHFYRLEPSSSSSSLPSSRSSRSSQQQPPRSQQKGDEDNNNDNNNNENEIFELSDTDHLENTVPGHAFCLGYVESEDDDEIQRFRNSKSLLLQQQQQQQQETATSAKEEDVAATTGSNIVVAGYRPLNTKPPPPSKAVSSSMLLSRQLQLVTISHNNNNNSNSNSNSSSNSSSSSSNNNNIITQSSPDRRRHNRLRRPPPVLSKPTKKRTRRTGGGIGLASCFSRCWNRRTIDAKAKDSDDDENNDGGGASGDEEEDPRDASPSSPLDPGGWRVETRWVTVVSKPVDTTDKFYEDRRLGGWPCKLEPNWSGGSDDDDDDDAVSSSRLGRDLSAAAALLPEHAREYLRASCTVWVNRSISWGPSDAPVRGRNCCYHPGREWLVRNGLAAEKHMCVEINDGPSYRETRGLWGPGGLILHELSHAYHHSMLPDGYDNAEIRNCYDRAMEEGLYESAAYHTGVVPNTGEEEEREKGSSGGGGGGGGGNTSWTKTTKRAYASTNAMEYFAELSVAFLGGLDETREFNKWYPFNRRQLKDHDPRAHDLLSRLWKIDVDVVVDGDR